ncbi:MAG: PD-(D/E)XK nuclease family protein [Phycisphaerae bacterium]
MAVQFILGRSGTGKTSYCVDAIANALLDEKDNRRLLFLVPEQATFQAERLILSHSKISGYNRLGVLSFDRLSYLLLGRNTARPVISRVAQQMIIHRLAATNKDKLKIFGKMDLTCGLALEISKVISEMCRYAKDSEDIDNFVKDLDKDKKNSLTALKFADIAVILREYTAFIKDNYIDPDIQLNTLRKVIDKSEFLKGARLWVDGFSGFTASEFQILAELLKVCSDSYIAFCLDPRKFDAEKIGLASGFEPTEKTYTNLLEIIKKCKLKIAQPVILEKALRFQKNHALAHLEKNFFIFSPQKEKSNSSIRITAAANARSEVQFIAKEIKRLVREKGYRYRDIAIIASSLDMYEHYIRGYLGDKNIPYFIDKRQPLDEHIVVKFVRSALAAVTGGFKNSDIFSYLKCGLSGLDSYEIDKIENYCIAFGVNPDDWSNNQDWKFAGPNDKEFEEEQINRTRLKTIEPLIRLGKLLGYDNKQFGEITAEQFTKAVFAFICEMKVYEQIANWIENSLAKNQKVQADKHKQFCEKFADVFDELSEAFCGYKLTCSQWSEIISSGLSQITFALIPPSLDQILVGSIERSRHPDLKAAFIIGCTQNQFPIPLSYDGILSETDRQKAIAGKFELGPGLKDNLAQMEYLSYIAFTRPSERLYISYPLLEGESGSAVRSQFVSRILSMFDDITIESAAAKISLENLDTENELAELICRQLGKDPAVDETEKDRLFQILQEMSAQEQFTNTAGQINAAVNYDNLASLHPQTAEQIFANNIDTSATRLETFAQCPYQYFAKYELKLNERKEFKFEPLDKGLFYHKVLDEMIKELISQKADIAALSDDKLTGIIQKKISELCQNDVFIKNFISRSKHNIFIIETAADAVKRCILAVAQASRAGDFRPAQSERYFDNYQIKLPAGQTLVIKGKIDRIDTANIDGKNCAVIFDYKLHGRTYGWAEFYHGLDMQLVIYMLAVKNEDNDKLEPIGAFYMPIEISTSDKPEYAYKAKGIFNGEFYNRIDTQADRGVSRFYNFRVSREHEQYGDYGRSGALKTDDFEKVLDFGKKKIIKLAEQIVSGRIDVSPYRLNNKVPCGLCKYKPVCRFDWQINDYRPLEYYGKTAVLEKI